MSDSSLRLIIPPQLRKMVQRHQIMCGCEICIQAVTYQYLLNNWFKRRLIYINNDANSLTRGSSEQLNAETIFSRYSDFVLTNGKSIHPRVKDAAFSSMCDFTKNISSFHSGHVC